MDTWRYSPAEDLEQPLPERLRRFPREPDMAVYGLRLGAAAVMRGWLKAWHRIEFQGREHLPARGPMIIAANHASHLDAACIAAALPLARVHRVFPAAARDYFFINLSRLALAVVVMNALPFDRRGRTPRSLRLCQRLLSDPEAGNVLVLFPEGTRSATGRIGSFRPGIGFLAESTGAPVVPCHIDGAHRAWPKGTLLPRPRRVSVRFGPPRVFRAAAGGSTEAGCIADWLRAAVLDLSPEPQAQKELSP